MDSSIAVIEGERVAIITVLHLPPSDSCNIRVSFESLSRFNSYKKIEGEARHKSVFSK